MKYLKSVLIVLMFITFESNAQTTIDIVRASNYYSKAVNSYKSGSYSSALQNLKNAETNLKGKTNKDLEYLKIVTYYKLKDFKKAYSLVITYFEKGYKDRIQYFKNIETFREKYNIKYDESLTEIFVELENKYGVVSSTSHGDVIQDIVQRIKQNKKDISEFIRSTTSSEGKILLYEWRTKKFRQGYGGYDYSNRKHKYIYEA